MFGSQTSPAREPAEPCPSRLSYGQFTSSNDNAILIAIDPISRLKADRSEFNRHIHLADTVLLTFAGIAPQRLDAEIHGPDGKPCHAQPH
jgi:hypothetical protein